MEILEFKQLKLSSFLILMALFFTLELFQNRGFKNYFSKNTSWFAGLAISIINVILLHFLFGDLLLKKMEALSSKDFFAGHILAESILVILFMDHFTYWWHRVNHRVFTLWRFHEVHHLDESLNIFSATRFHFGEIIISFLLRLGIFTFLPIHLESYLIFESLYALFNIFAHANISLPYSIESKINLIFVTPRFHRLHHHPKREIHDTNFSTIFSFWDRIYKSHTKILEKDSFSFGVKNRPRKSLGGLLLSPFKPLVTKKD